MEKNPEDFLRKKKSDYDQRKKAIDWQQRIDWWKTKIDALYMDILGWLAPLKNDGTVEIIKSEAEFYEELLGNYTAPTLQIVVGSEAVMLSPIGTIIIAAFGRIDVIGDNRTVMLLLEQKGHRPQIKVQIGLAIEPSKTSEKPSYDQIETEWIVADTNYRKGPYSILDKDTFFDVLKRVMQK